jgi:tetratricopeptide (TPR) repeat protein
MKLKKNILVAGMAVLSFAFAKAQQSNDCNVMLSIYAENAKAKNYDEAYKQLGPLVEKCPDASAAIYQYGEQIYEYRLKNKIGDVNENVDGLIKMLKSEVEKFPKAINVTKKETEMATVMYKYHIGTQQEQFDILHNDFKQDPENFTSPKAIMTYFTLAEKQYNDGKMDLQELFNIYDELTAHIEDLQDERSAVVTELLDKEQEGQITAAEQKKMKYQQINLKNYGIVMGSVNGTLGALADCDKLIPLYDAEFEINSNNKLWLSNVLVRLQKKDCTDDPLYIKSVKALHALNPSAKTAYGLGNIASSDSEKFKYWDEAIALGVDKDLESKIHYKKATVYKSKGQYNSAKREYLLATKAKPSYGLPYLRIAEMIANSTSSCGSNPFEKRAINWVAARYADRAASVDPSIKSTAQKTAASYRAAAPSKQMIFTSAYKSGTKISFNCWIGESVRVP